MQGLHNADFFCDKVFYISGSSTVPNAADRRRSFSCFFNEAPETVNPNHRFLEGIITLLPSSSPLGMLAGGAGKWGTATMSIVLDPEPKEDVLLTITPPPGFSVQNGKAGEARTISILAEQQEQYIVSVSHPGSTVRQPAPLLISSATSQDKLT